ncbi:OmpA family protein [Granulicella sp. WH15]|uniref:OmpA family protein n=1 Tax=Granulicella sp. WH15 TaxID=2602070 RepID=UPI0013679B5A|nr:OmpA family protein [Granulicella sp. WH15]QHN02494.1 OmpA family protein [Granulicella sp. WH15]
MNLSTIARRRTPAFFLGAAFALSLSLPALVSAQEPNPTSVPAPAGAVVTQNGDVFFYQVKVVQRDIDAVNYLHRSGSTKIGFVGTELLQAAKGEAVVKSQNGQTSIDAKFSGLTPANSFGAEYLTYVLWAITPEGRPVNLGEILPSSGGKSSIQVTTALQAFGLIITAEPYFAVSTPSDVIVVKNVIINDKTNGVLEKVNTKATLMPRGIYTFQGTNENPITRNEKSPLELYEAYNAVRIAQAAGADQYAPDIMAKAKLALKNAADMDSNKKRDLKMEITFARGAVQSAEDARISTLRKKADERRRNDQAAKERAQREAEQSQLAAQQSQLQAAQAQAAAAQSAAAQAQAEAERLRAQHAAAAAQDAAARSAAEVTAARERLRAQLNKVLQTNETARGLIVNLSDVLFDTGRYTLKQDTKISLAKVAVILQAYPSLKLQVEGYTDSVGSDDYNQKLSENRANTVKDFLISQGTDPGSITSAGYGKANPVADNGTAAGRKQNRRVDLIVSGAAIGVPTSAPPAQ